MIVVHVEGGEEDGEDQGRGGDGGGAGAGAPVRGGDGADARQEPHVQRTARGARHVGPQKPLRKGQRWFEPEVVAVLAAAPRLVAVAALEEPPRVSCPGIAQQKTARQVSLPHARRQVVRLDARQLRVRRLRLHVLPERQQLRERPEARLVVVVEDVEHGRLARRPQAHAALRRLAPHQRRRRLLTGAQQHLRHCLQVSPLRGQGGAVVFFFLHHVPR
mmetsp:Transcript_21683/g.66831  ORF Transcript_21683/g.66831 Transcript_21683/m.66831 type:complete len:218 (-) Transcript_21683:1-654(-)